MAPAEILQGGKVANKVAEENTHKGKLDGKVVVVRDAPPGCQLTKEDESVGRYLQPGDSVTLDGGEIVKSST